MVTTLNITKEQIDEYLRRDGGTETFDMLSERFNRMWISGLDRARAMQPIRRDAADWHNSNRGED